MSSTKARSDKKAKDLFSVASIGALSSALSIFCAGNAAIAQGYSPPGLTNGVPQSAALTPPPVAGGNMMGQVPKFDPNFFAQMQASRVNPGTVLTGILENDISSKSSQSGDIFFIRLEDGYMVNGQQVVPPQSKILGTVTSSVSSHARKGAMPGSISIALQTLVLPDGRTMPFTGFIQHNPQDDAQNQSSRNPAKTAGSYVASTGYGVANFVGRRVGFPVYRPNFGKELELKKGEVLPIRLNGTIDISKATMPVNSIPNGQMSQALANRNAPNGLPFQGGPQGQAPMGRPSMAGAFPGQPGQIPQNAPNVGLSAGQMGSLSQQPPAVAGGFGGNGGYTPGLSAPSAQSYMPGIANPAGSFNAPPAGSVPGLSEPF